MKQAGLMTRGELVEEIHWRRQVAIQTLKELELVEVELWAVPGVEPIAEQVRDLITELTRVPSS